MREARILPEPGLEFGHGQVVADPHDGLALFGPYDTEQGSRPGSVQYAVVGTGSGLRALGALVELIRGPICVDESQGLSQDLWPPFPGFDAAFLATWPNTPAWSEQVDENALLRCARMGDAHERAYAVVDTYLSAFKKARIRDEKCAVAFCVVPEEVWLRCRPQSSVPTAVRSSAPHSSRARALAFGGQQDLLDPEMPTRLDYSVDFRRQLKARMMEYGIPVQIVRETTLRLTDDNSNPAERGLSPLSDRAWNLCTTAYYKAGGKPWRLAAARPGVCYVGLAFKLTDHTGRSNSAVCAAQMFLESGDGIVFKGEVGPWYSDQHHSFHLPPDTAERLLKGVLETYARLEGKPLTEVFLHSRSDIGDDEFAGYSRAVPAGVKLVGVRVRSEGSDGIKLLRMGHYPVLRGLFWPLSDRSGLLWGHGFIPRMAKYPGTEVPIPVRIDVQHGDADIELVAHDILALTKLNFNACRYGESQPVTVGFSDAVGEILVSNPRVTNALPQFRFYI